LVVPSQRAELQAHGRLVINEQRKCLDYFPFFCTRSLNRGRGCDTLHESKTDI
jgi:hypothetical protein